MSMGDNQVPATIINSTPPQFSTIFLASRKRSQPRVTASAISILVANSPALQIHLIFQKDSF